MVIRKGSIHNNLSSTLTNRIQVRAENTSLSLMVGSLLFCYIIEDCFGGLTYKLTMLFQCPQSGINQGQNNLYCVTPLGL